jgi:FkbM family methyltransferase
LAGGRRVLAAKRENRSLERAARALLGQFVARGEMTFDIGANVGARTRTLLSLGARVVAVEPQPNCVAELDRAFRRNSRVTVVASAVAATSGEAQMHVNDLGVLSSLSEEWIGAVERSGRFEAFNSRWGETITVPTVTLDELIARHGKPVFCKVDVEGFEPEVFGGLTQAIPAVSFEYTPEARNNLVLAVERISALGEAAFAFSPGETFELMEFGWVSGGELLSRLEDISDPTIWGDVYARTAS